MAIIKKRRTAFALLLWFSFVFLVAYISPGRTVENNLTAGLSKTSKSSRVQPAPPAPSTPEKWHGRPARDRVRAEPATIDSDNDGIPNSAELQSFTERESFRRWFTGIAEMQFYQLDAQWHAEQRDCAGLVRFVWREALRVHDRAWFQKMGGGYESFAPDVRSYSIETSPLCEKLFRTAFGSFKATDIAAGKFSEFADGRTLKNFNTVFISRDRRQAQAGDLLFFYQPWVQKFPYHVMILIGAPRIAPNTANDWVVYHTGASPHDEGVVKKVELSVLDHHPDPRWRPTESNKNFLGFYRLKILD